MFLTVVNHHQADQNWVSYYFITLQYMIYKPSTYSSSVIEGLFVSLFIEHGPVNFLSSECK